MVQISHNSEQGMVNWVDFAQFAVNFEGSIFCCVNGWQNSRYSLKIRAFWLIWGCAWIFVQMST